MSIRSPVVPGPVSNSSIQPSFPSVLVAWEAPREPNGVIVRYEVTYRVNGGKVVTTDVARNTMSTIYTTGLPQGSIISAITVTAYTSVGSGKATSLPDVVILEQSECSNLLCSRLHGCAKNHNSIAKC